MTGQVDKREVSFKAFARILDVSPSYVTELKDKDRLVLSEDGRRVVLEDSLALIRETADPARAGVAARHEANRAARGAGEAEEPDTGEPPADADLESGASADPVAASHTRRRAKALADKAETDAKAAERDYRRSMGELLEAGQVVGAVRAVFGVLRKNFENLPVKLAPELAALDDESRIRVLLTDALQHEFAALSRKLAAIAKDGESA